MKEQDKGSMIKRMHEEEKEEEKQGQDDNIPHAELYTAVRVNMDKPIGYGDLVEI